MERRIVYGEAVAGGCVHVWGKGGSGDAQFNFPTGIAILNDMVIVSDSRNHRVQCFHVNGQFIRKWGSKGSDDGQFQFPTGLAIGVSHRVRESILAVMKEVHELRTFPPGVLPICVAYVGDECIYVTDTHT